MLSRVARASNAGLAAARRIRTVAAGITGVLLPVIVAVILVAARGGAIAAATPAKSLATAGSQLAAAIGPGGQGFNFFATQRTTEYQRAGGTAIAVVDPSDDRKVIGQTDHLFINAMMSKGFVRPDGFFMDMRLGSSTSGAADFASAPTTFSVLARDATTWRNDGQGWYQTAELPGMGIDLVTIRQLPSAFGHVVGLTASGTDNVNGVAASVYSGSLTPTDYPGAVAAGGASFTDSTIAFKVWIAGDGRPLQLWIRARNTNQPIYDLVSETTLSFDFTPAAALPSAAPTLAPESPPSAEPAASPVAVQ
jgi:hypothetical protein